VVRGSYACLLVGFHSARYGIDPPSNYYTSKGTGAAPSYYSGAKVSSYQHLWAPNNY